MEDAPIVSDDRQEAARLAAYAPSNILDSDRSNEPGLLRLVRLAARLFDAPKAAIVLVDERRIWRKAYVGYPGPESPRDGDLAARVDRRQRPGRARRAAPQRTGPALGALVVEGPGLTGPASDEDLQALEDLAELAAESLARTLRVGATSSASGWNWPSRPPASASSSGTSNATSSRSARAWPPSRTSSRARCPPRTAWCCSSTCIPRTREWAPEFINKQLKETGRYDVEYRRPNSPEGRETWNHGSGVVLLGADGEPAYLIGVVQDITERKEEEDQRENLVAELDHRIKNLLAVVQSVAAQSARKSASLDVFLKTFAGRLKSMSSAHDLLTAARWRGATLARIAAAELGGLSPTQTRWDGPEMFLTPRAASALSLALHELAVNAMRYGSLSSENGKVEVVWRRTPEGGFALEWLETGGPPATAPTTKGFGATVIEDVAGRELGGSAKINYKSSGVTAMIHGRGRGPGRRPPPSRSSKPRPSASSRRWSPPTRPCGLAPSPA
jgi:two-component sensor histidine kinase